MKQTFIFLFLLMSFTLQAVEVPRGEVQQVQSGYAYHDSRRTPKIVAASIIGVVVIGGMVALVLTSGSHHGSHCHSSSSSSSY